jgi:hypothetical protein
LQILAEGNLNRDLNRPALRGDPRIDQSKHDEVSILLTQIARKIATDLGLDRLAHATARSDDGPFGGLFRLAEQVEHELLKRD